MELDFVDHRTNITESENELEFHLYKTSRFNKSRLQPFPWPYISTNTFMLGVADHVKATYYLLDRSINAHEVQKNIHPKEVKDGQIVFVKTEFIHAFFDLYHPQINASYLLISMHSDLSAGTMEELKFLDDPKIIAWYALNGIGKHPKFHPLPLGLPEMQPGFQGNTDPDLVRSVSRRLIPWKKRKNLLYLNFRPTHEKRAIALKAIIKNFGNQSNVFYKWNILLPPIRIKPPPDYRETLLEMGDSKFVVSPIGVGIDCFRTWEALIMGAIPIVLRTGIQSLYDDMPVMVVENYTEVSEQSLEDFQSRLNISADGVPWRPKIWLRYWMNRFKNEIRKKHKYWNKID